MNRNRYIIRALERALKEATSWSPRFLSELSAAASNRGDRKAVEQMTQAIRQRRTRKGPPEL